MARLFCPWCRRALPEGETHCPRCGLRIAALDRPRRRDLEAAGVLTATPARPPSLRAALLLGGAGGTLLVGLAVVIALAISRGSGFATTLSNVAFFTGGGAATVAVALGGVRISRVYGELEHMKERAHRGGALHAAHAHVRLTFATAAVLPLAVAIGLAAAAH
jgi:hypothetical protein